MVRAGAHILAERATDFLSLLWDQGSGKGSLSFDGPGLVGIPLRNHHDARTGGP